ncbi:MAG: hypothetical protein IKE42_15105 [Aquamicrobium sp.]|nr:hypothetical protein [Aquamicrobium sp.]
MLGTFDPAEGALSDYQRWKAAARCLVYELPETGCTIIVATRALGKILKEGITELRGAKVARKARLLPIWRRDDVEKLNGLRGPVFVDPLIWLQGSRDVVWAVSAAVATARIIT